MSSLDTLRQEMVASLAKVEADLSDRERRRSPWENPLTDEGEMALAAFLGGVLRRLGALESLALPAAPEREAPTPEVIADPANRRKVLEVLRASSAHFLQPGAIAEEAGIDRAVVRVIAQELADAGMVAREVRQFGPVYRYGGKVQAEPTEQPKSGAVTIVTRRRAPDDWTAYPENDPAKWEAGTNEAEAVGKLTISHPELFGVVVTRATP